MHRSKELSLFEASSFSRIAIIGLPTVAASASPPKYKEILKTSGRYCGPLGSDRNDERSLMLARLGDVFYGTACVLAVLFAVIVSLTPGNNFKPENFIGVIVIWLIARACRYVLAGR
jgi:hypothetical protein